MGKEHSENRDESRMRKLLHQHNIDVTRPRLRILALLQVRPHPSTSKELHAALEESCNLATVYRFLHLLEKQGLVKRFEFGDGRSRFEWIEDREDHHHHLICRECSLIIEFEECFSAEMEERITKHYGFGKLTHQLEFFGVCPSCQ